MTAAISAQGLTKRFTTGRTFVVVLKNVDFEAGAGQVTMVMARLAQASRPDRGALGAA